MLTGKRRSKVKLIGAFIIIAGALVVVAAGVTLGMVSSELKAEHITVPGVAPEGLARPGAKPDADVFDSYAPAGLSQASSATVSHAPARDAGRHDERVVPASVVLHRSRRSRRRCPGHGRRRHVRSCRNRPVEGLTEAEASHSVAGERPQLKVLR